MPGEKQNLFSGVVVTAPKHKPSISEVENKSSPVTNCLDGFTSNIVESEICQKYGMSQTKHKAHKVLNKLIRKTGDVSWCLERGLEVPRACFPCDHKHNHRIVRFEHVWLTTIILFRIYDMTRNPYTVSLKSLV